MILATVDEADDEEDDEERVPRDEADEDAADDADDDGVGDVLELDAPAVAGRYGANETVASSEMKCRVQPELTVERFVESVR